MSIYLLDSTLERSECPSLVFQTSFLSCYNPATLAHESSPLGENPSNSLMIKPSIEE